MCLLGIGFDEDTCMNSIGKVNTFLPFLANFIAGTGKDISYGISNPVVNSTFLYLLPHKLTGFGAAFKILRSHLQMTLPLSLFQMGTPATVNVVFRSNPV